MNKIQYINHKYIICKLKNINYTNYQLYILFKLIKIFLYSILAIFYDYDLILNLSKSWVN